MHYICKIEAPSTPDVNIELSAAQADWQLYRHGVYVSHTGPAQLTRRAKVRYYVKTKQSYFAYYIKYRIYFLNFLTQIDTYLQQKSFNQIIQPRSQVTFKFLTFIFNVNSSHANQQQTKYDALSILYRHNSNYYRHYTSYSSQYKSNLAIFNKCQKVHLITYYFFFNLNSILYMCSIHACDYNSRDVTHTFSYTH